MARLLVVLGVRDDLDFSPAVCRLLSYACPFLPILRGMTIAPIYLSLSDQDSLSHSAKNRDIGDNERYLTLTKLIDGQPIQWG